MLYLATKMILNNNINLMQKLKDSLITLALFGEIEIVLINMALAWDDM